MIPIRWVELGRNKSDLYKKPSRRTKVVFVPNYASSREVGHGRKGNIKRMMSPDQFTDEEAQSRSKICTFLESQPLPLV